MFQLRRSVLSLSPIAGLYLRTQVARLTAGPRYGEAQTWHTDLPFVLSRQFSTDGSRDSLNPCFGFEMMAGEEFEEDEAKAGTRGAAGVEEPSKSDK
jgi:hypothetical protein